MHHVPLSGIPSEKAVSGADTLSRTSFTRHMAPVHSRELQRRRARPTDHMTRPSRQTVMHKLLLVLRADAVITDNFWDAALLCRAVSSMGSNHPSPSRFAFCSRCLFPLGIWIFNPCLFLYRLRILQSLTFIRCLLSPGNVPAFDLLSLLLLEIL